mmetsp:Transcript_9883/g.24338  ORF Transcript_9883/g.24338 Transcript_9883/m.24338 type:complete len:204 (-) Transcript_9883:223-834(-)
MTTQSTSPRGTEKGRTGRDPPAEKDHRLPRATIGGGVKNGDGAEAAPAVHRGPAVEIDVAAGGIATATGDQIRAAKRRTNEAAWIGKEIETGMRIETEAGEGIGTETRIQKGIEIRREPESQTGAGIQTGIENRTENDGKTTGNVVETVIETETEIEIRKTAIVEKIETGIGIEIVTGTANGTVTEGEETWTETSLRTARNKP